MLEETVIDTPVDSPVDDSSIEETPIDDAPEVEDAHDESDGIDGEESDEDGESEGDEEEPIEGETTPDGRMIRDSIKKGLKALGKLDPAAAKELKGVYWEREEYKAVFEKPADAVAAKHFLDEIGGQEGIQEISAEREEWRQIDADFSEGKPDFVKSLAEGNPDAFLKTAPHVINEFASRAPEQYQYYANNVAINTLANTGLTIDNLAAAYHRYADNPQAQTIIAEVHNSLVGLKEKATQFEQKRTDPEREKLNQDKAAFEQGRRADFEDRVDNDAKAYLSSKMQPAIDLVVNGRKVDPEAMKGYHQMVKAEVEKRLGAIPGFADKLEAHYRTGDAKRSLDYVQKQYDRILPEAAKVIDPFLRNIAPAKAAPAAKTAATGKAAAPGEITLKEMPDHSQIDFNQCTVADVMSGHCVLKSGKKASGWL